MSERARGARLGPALLVALLAAALAAGLFVYHQRTPDLALEVPDLDRRLGTAPEERLPVELEFFVRFDEPRARIEIVGSGDTTAYVLAEAAELRAEERVRCRWVGLDDRGAPVSPGNYRLRVVLPGQDRDMVFPLRILVRREPPAKAEPGRCVTVADGEVLG